MNGGIHQGTCIDDLQIAALRSEVDCPIPRIQIKFRGVRCIGCALMQLDACSGNHIQVVRVDDTVLFEIAFNPATIRVQIDSICAVREVADGTVEDEIAACMHVHFAARIPVHIAARHVHIVLVAASGELHVDPIACGDPVGVARPLRRDLVPLMEVNAVLKGRPPPFIDHVGRAVTVIDTFPVFLLPFSIVLGDGRRIRENLGVGLIFVSVHAIVLAIHISRAEIDTVRQDVPLRRRRTDTHRAIFNILLGDIGADIARCPMTVGKEALPVGVARLCLRAAPAARPVVGQIFFRIIVRIVRFAAAPLRSLFEFTLIRLLCADGVGAVGTVAQILGCLARIPVIEGNPAAAYPAAAGAVDRARDSDIAAARLHRIGKEIALLRVVVDGRTVPQCLAGIVPVGLTAADEQTLLCTQPVSIFQLLCSMLIKAHLIGGVTALDDSVDVDVACRNRDVLARDP